MNAAIVCVGTELLFGDVLNTNGTYLAKFLTQLQIYVMRMEVVGDNEERLIEVVERLKKDHDLLVFSGGLGPTVDDITKTAVCKALGAELIPIFDPLPNILDRVGIKMSMNNLKQVMFPRDAILLENDHGTAPGMFYEVDGLKVVLLPGPPHELVPMCENKLLPILRELVNTNLVSKYLNVYGISESKLEEKIEHVLEKQVTCKIGTYNWGDKVTLRLTATDANRRRAYIADYEARIRMALKDYIITEGEDTLEELIVSSLKESGFNMAVAESCTGGLLAARITSVPGASAVFDRGFVTYSNKSKMKHLGVDKRDIDHIGAASDRVAMQMAAGLGRISGADLTCGITGIAGPTGDGSKTPVGTVYIAIWSKLINPEVKKFEFVGTRESIRKQAVTNALMMLANSAILIKHMYKRRQPDEEQ